MFKKILLCTDGSEHSIEAAGVAAEIAAKFGSDVIVINVLHPVPMVAPYVNAAEMSLDYQSIQEEAKSHQRETISTTIAELEKHGIKAESLESEGHSVSGIVESARDIDADLIVMGSRGMGGFQRFLLGSVSDGVLHHAECPVLIVR